MRIYVQLPVTFLRSYEVCKCHYESQTFGVKGLLTTFLLKKKFDSLNVECLKPACEVIVMSTFFTRVNQFKLHSSFITNSWL